MTGIGSNEAAKAVVRRNTEEVQGLDHWSLMAGKCRPMKRRK
jgi:hypothetical protein